MIIGNSLDATYFSVYKRLDDSNEIVRANYCNGFNEFEGDDDYEFVGYETENYIPDDDWDMSLDYKSNEINLLIECDYCGEDFIITERNRLDKISSFRGSMRLSDYEIEDGEDTLYKDNCKKCQNTKVKETTLLTKGVAHFTHTEEGMQNFKKKWMDAMGKGYVKSSRGQRYLADMFSGVLNKPIGNFFADIVIEDKIVIEYDGGGHNLSVLRGSITQLEFDKAEINRENILIEKGYKILRFISHSEYFPEESVTKKIVSDAIADLYLTDLNKIVIRMGNKVNDPRYGKLQPIKKILETSEFGGEGK